MPASGRANVSEIRPTKPTGRTRSTKPFIASSTLVMGSVVLTAAPGSGGSGLEVNCKKIEADRMLPTGLVAARAYMDDYDDALAAADDATPTSRTQSW